MSDWPELPIAAWRDTCATLQLYAQIVGKVRLALTPRLNEWWNVPLYITTRGLGTSPMPYRDRLVSIDFDFVDHRVVIHDSLGRTRGLALTPKTVCDFHTELFAELAALDVHVQIDPLPQECPVTTAFTDDTAHASYDPEWARRFWQVLARMEPTFQAFRAGFRGKCSPVHFFWGSFDLAVTRFNGRRVPAREGMGMVERIAYDEEVCSLGFWPGDPWEGTYDASFYAYTVPTPAGFGAERVAPQASRFDQRLQQFHLSYADVQRAKDPAAELAAFARSTYERGAKLAGWDLDALAYP